MHQATRTDAEIQAAFYAGYTLGIAEPGATPRFHLDELDELAACVAGILARRTVTA